MYDIPHIRSVVCATGGSHITLLCGNTRAARQARRTVKNQQKIADTSFRQPNSVAARALHNIIVESIVPAAIDIGVSVVDIMRLSFATAILTESLIPSSTEAKELPLPLHPSKNDAAWVPSQGNKVVTGVDDAERGNHGKLKRAETSRVHSIKHRASLNLHASPSRNPNEEEVFAECDPSDASPDVGVLSCDAGSHCAESAGSSLGGVCVQDRAHSKGGGATLPSRRRRQQVVGRLTIFEIADLFCNNAETTNVTVSCECEVDFEAYEGQFSCYFGPECVDVGTGCEDQTEFTLCSTENLSAYMESKTSYVYTSCYAQRMPASGYSFTYCTDFGYTAADGPTCSIQVEGVTCDSCYIDIGGGEAEGENCEVFDCSNTPINYSGDRCRAFSYPALRGASVVEYLYSYVWGSEQTCSPNACNLCGENGRMTNHDANFTYSPPFLSTGTTFVCSEINSDALTGRLVDSDYCQTLSALAEEPCGCVDGTSSDRPADEPTAAPTEEPTTDDDEPPSDAPPSDAPPSDAPPSDAPPPVDPPSGDPITPSTEAPIGSGAATMGSWGRSTQQQAGIGGAVVAGALMWAM